MNNDVKPLNNLQRNRHVNFSTNFSLIMTVKIKGKVVPMLN
jgi:hypothetical protein